MSNLKTTLKSFAAIGALTALGFAAQADDTKPKAGAVVQVEKEASVDSSIEGKLSNKVSAGSIASQTEVQGNEKPAATVAMEHSDESSPDVNADCGQTCRRGDTGLGWQLLKPPGETTDVDTAEVRSRRVVKTPAATTERRIPAVAAPSDTGGEAGLETATKTTDRRINDITKVETRRRIKTSTSDTGGEGDLEATAKATERAIPIPARTETLTRRVTRTSSDTGGEGDLDATVKTTDRRIPAITKVETRRAAAPPSNTGGEADLDATAKATERGIPAVSFPQTRRVAAPSSGTGNSPVVEKAASGCEPYPACARNKEFENEQNKIPEPVIGGDVQGDVESEGNIALVAGPGDNDDIDTLGEHVGPKAVRGGEDRLTENVSLKAKAAAGGEDRLVENVVLGAAGSADVSEAETDAAETIGGNDPIDGIDIIVKKPSKK